MTPQSEAEVIDFKPFFDMIVGILFILLIFIAAQLFFTKWDDPIAEIEARERTRQLSYQWQQQSTDLLQDIAARLQRGGLSAEFNATAQSVTMPLSELVSVSDRGASELDRRNELVGRILADRLRCVPGQVGVASSDCPSLPLLRLAGIQGEVRVADAPAGVSLTPERYAYFISSLLGAELLRGSPELASLTGSGGVPALRVVGINRQGPKGAATPQGEFVLAFSFEPPNR